MEKKAAWRQLEIGKQLLKGIHLPCCSLIFSACKYSFISSPGISLGGLGKAVHWNCGPSLLASSPAGALNGALGLHFPSTYLIKICITAQI